MVIKKSQIKIIFLVVVLYLYVYAPPLRILPVNISLLLSFGALFFFFLNPKRIGLFLEFRREILILFALLVYAIILFPVASVPNFLTPLSLLFFKIPFCLWVAIKLDELSNNNYYGYDLLLNLLIFIGVVAAIFSIFLWNSPELANEIKFSVLKYDEELMKYQMHRAFGFSDELLFSFSLVQSTIFAAALFRYGWSKRVLLVLPLIFASILVNARIGFIFLCLSIIIGVKIKDLLSSVLVVVFVCFFLLWLFSLGDLDQGDSIFYQLPYFLRDLDIFNNDDSVILSLFGDMFIFPDNVIGLFFGEGVNLFGVSSGSDSGYVNLIFFGGLFYLGLVFLFFVSSCLRLNFIGFKSLSFFLFLLFFVSSFKGGFFMPKPGMNLFLLLYVCIVYFHNVKIRDAEALR